MNPLGILGLIGCYFIILMVIGYFTGRSANNETFFTGNRNSKWYVVAFGMIGASLSGVTFLSVPGWVEASQFSYMQTVLGYLIGYIVIARVLLPLYYRLNLTSIYTYLQERFGEYSYKTGSILFLISRLIGSSLRLYLVAIVLYKSVFEPLHWPFWLTVFMTIALIWIYTFKGGIKTVVYTDTLQTTFMLVAVGLTVYFLKDQVLGDGESIVEYVSASPLSQVFFFDDQNFFGFFGADSRNFFKQVLGGMFITISMTGLDQDMMQKNLTCRNLKEAQKNMYFFSGSLVFVNLLFLALGVLLYGYAGANGLDVSGDKLYGTIALGGHLPAVISVFFIIGLIAAAYSSADSALTALTTSFSVDILGIDHKNDESAILKRRLVHIGMSIIMMIIIIVSKYYVDDSVINLIFKAAGYTYGPLLGMFAFGLYSKRKVQDKYVPIIALISPLLTYWIAANSNDWFGYVFSFELILFNGLLTWMLLWLNSIISK